MTMRCSAKTAIWRVLLIAPVLAAGVAFAAPAPAEAAFVCTETVWGEKIKQSMTVPVGATCILEENTVVRGSVTSGAGAVFEAYFSDVRGTITATGYDTFLLCATVVRGSVTSTGGTGYVSVCGFFSTIKGTLSYTGNIEGQQAVIGGNVISADLSCAGNDPDQTDNGTGNDVGGKKSGECAEFGPIE